MENYHIPAKYRGIAKKGIPYNQEFVQFSTDVDPGSKGVVVIEKTKNDKCCKECGHKTEEIIVNTHWIDWDSFEYKNNYIIGLWSSNTKSISYIRTVIPN